ncbi:MAG TPA: DUF1761 domain-containing protein [Bauldia sp.]|nr:DUF1761 domain-containing protein [Bauldia sp.]
MEVNLLAVVVAAIVKFAIGAVWFTALFGQQWRSLLGVPEGAPTSGLAQAMIVQIIGDLIMAYVLARFIVHYGGGIGTGILVSAMAWLAFVATIGAGQIFYEKRKPQIFAIASGYQLVSMVVMGIILGWWHAGAAVAAPAA